MLVQKEKPGIIVVVIIIIIIIIMIIIIFPMAARLRNLLSVHQASLP